MKNTKLLATVALVAATGFAAKPSFANSGLAGLPLSEGGIVKFPGSTEMDRALDRLNEAWSALRAETSIRSMLRVSKNSLSAMKKVSYRNLETIKFQHYYNGLEVVGSLAMHQRSAKGTEVLNRLSELDLDTNPRLSAEEAVAVAKSLTGDRALDAKPELKILPDAEGGGARLVYWIDIDGRALDGGREVVLDANSGEVIGNISKNEEIAPVDVHSAKNQGALITEQGDEQTGLSGCTVTDMSTGEAKEISAAECQKLSLSDLPANPCQVVADGDPIAVFPQNCQAQVTHSQAVGNDPSAIRAYQNASAVLNYYMTHHDRNSYDNRGSVVVNVVHIGQGFDNAFWNTQGNYMVYGDGDGKTFGDFTQALDVAGHEQTHGVVSQTSKFQGMGENGALNEAFADFFGKMIANDGDWAIGRKVFMNPATAPGVRNLANPASLKFCAAHSSTGQCTSMRPYPVTISQKMATTGACDGTNDNCWVHANSTIPSHVSYLVVQAIGQQKAETLYYAALTQSLTSRDSITTAARSIKATCPKVLDSASCALVNKAYATAGL